MSAAVATKTRMARWLLSGSACLGADGLQPAAAFLVDLPLAVPSQAGPFVLAEALPGGVPFDDENMRFLGG